MLSFKVIFVNAFFVFLCKCYVCSAVLVMLEKNDAVWCSILTCQAAEACGTLEIDSALDTVGSLGRDLEAYEKSAEDGKLLPLPGDTVSCTGRHIILTKTLSFCIVNCSAIFTSF